MVVGFFLFARAYQLDVRVTVVVILFKTLVSCKPIKCYAMQYAAIYTYVRAGVSGRRTLQHECRYYLTLIKN